MTKPNLNKPGLAKGSEAGSSSDEATTQQPAVDQVPKKHHPDVKPGDVVYWYFAGETRNEPFAAMVTMVRTQGNLCLTVFTNTGQEIFDGVKHADDPALTATHRNRNGCWGIKD